MFHAYNATEQVAAKRKRMNKLSKFLIKTDSSLWEYIYINRPDLSKCLSGIGDVDLYLLDCLHDLVDEYNG